MPNVKDQNTATPRAIVDFERIPNQRKHANVGTSGQTWRGARISRDMGDGSLDTDFEKRTGCGTEHFAGQGDFAQIFLGAD
ncbi:hypothetical protein FHS46_003981 [Variibacter gotjawalensis]|nr:hypothetical protein [Variibacter gotjawalensis]NIK49601.1 hypothetical protein [Variibacter gotjawalensis]